MSLLQKTSSSSSSSKHFIFSKQDINCLIDGYSRKHKYNQKYIPIELCQIIILYLQFILNFIIIFEKDEYNNNVNKLLCFDIKSKTKIIKENKIWKHNICGSYCMHETKNDYLIYRIGGIDNNYIPN